MCPVTLFNSDVTCLVPSRTGAAQRAQVDGSLVRVLVHYNGRSSGIVRWKRGIERRTGKAFGASVPGTPPFQSLVLTYLEALQTLWVSISCIGASPRRQDG